MYELLCCDMTATNIPPNGTHQGCVSIILLIHFLHTSMGTYFAADKLQMVITAMFFFVFFFILMHAFPLFVIILRQIVIYSK